MLSVSSIRSLAWYGVANFFIAAQKYVLCTYNIDRSKLDIARKITPGRRAPTVNALEEDGWVAVQAMVLRKDIAIAMDKLTEVGATDLIVTKIENSRTGD